MFLITSGLAAPLHSAWPTASSWYRVSAERATAKSSGLRQLGSGEVSELWRHWFMPYLSGKRNYHTWLVGFLMPPEMAQNCHFPRTHSGGRWTSAAQAFR